jgi:L,D-transpeptidase YbiS
MTRKTINITAAAVSAGICVFIYGLMAKSDNSSPSDLSNLPERSPVNMRFRGKIRPNEKYIVIDRYSNRLYLRTSGKVLMTANCSTGSGAVLIDKESDRRWKFETPAGIYTVSGKLVEPWWRKPDWAFIEEDQPVPGDENERLDPEMLGKYAIGFGNGYFIHGTIYEKLLGVSVTHGCVRLGSGDLKKLYDNVQNGTLIFIY